jgi:hypothetical protein
MIYDDSKHNYFIFIEAVEVEEEEADQYECPIYDERG